MHQKIIYLDYNATSPIRESARKAWYDTSLMAYNASSIHQAGQKSRHLLEESRQNIAALLGAKNTNIVFTSGGTEANHLALLGFTNSLECGPLGVCNVQSVVSTFVSAVEHVSVLNVLENVKQIPVNYEGTINLDWLEDQLSKIDGRKLISVMLVNNETGGIQPIKSVVEIASKYNALVHTDAAQAVGKISVDFDDLGVDMLSFSSHKFGGPLGCGGLIIRDKLKPTPFMKGGGQEKGLRSGTINVPAIVASAVALEESIKEDKHHWKEWRDYLVSSLTEAGGLVFGPQEDLTYNTLLVGMPGVKNTTQLMHFDLSRIMVSAGSACSSGKVGASHVLRAMGVADELAESTVRVSWGHGTTIEEIESFVESWKALSDRV